MNKKAAQPIRLRVLRAEHRVSQEQIAVVCRCHRSLVSLWENGLADPDTDDLKVLSKFFGVPASDIFPGISAKATAA